MDSSKLTQMRAQASNTYRSNWQPRDASEVTMRHMQMSQKNNKSTHNGTIQGCCSDNKPPAERASSPTKGYSTTYSEQPVFDKKAGCAQCNDTNFGKSGGVELLNCAEVATILQNPANPVKGSSCYCAAPGIYRQPFPADCSIIQPEYTGSRNQVPIIKEQGENNGHLPKQQYPYPNG
jgi:hypothetical protein